MFNTLKLFDINAHSATLRQHLDAIERANARTNAALARLDMQDSFDGLDSFESLSDEDLRIASRF